MTNAVLSIMLLITGAPPSGDKEAAGRLLQEGNELLRSQRPADALARYEAAYDAYESPKILINIGEALLELGRRTEAATIYERALRGIDADDAAFTAATKRLSQLRSALGAVMIESEPPAHVTFDMNDVGSSPTSLRYVEPGPHSLTLTADGYEPAHRDIHVEATITSTVRVTLASTLVVSPPVVEEEGSSWWIWAGAGAAVVVATVVVIAVAGGGDDFVPGGELGSTTLDEWGRP